MNNCENNFNIKKKCPKICYINLLGHTGPTARCNKSSIYIFKW